MSVTHGGAQHTHLSSVPRRRSLPVSSLWSYCSHYNVHAAAVCRLLRAHALITVITRTSSGCYYWQRGGPPPRRRGYPFQPKYWRPPPPNPFNNKLPNYFRILSASEIYITDPKEGTWRNERNVYFKPRETSNVFLFHNLSTVID